MNITRKQLLYWGTLAIIAFFFLEFFWPLMYSREEAVTPTPEAQKSFSGSARTQARITYFLSDAFVSCNSSDAENAQRFRGLLAANNNFSAVRAVGEDGFTLKVNASNETLANEAFAQLLELTYSNCEPDGSGVLRLAALSLESSNLSFQSLESLSDSRTLYPKDILDAFRSYAKVRDVQGFVDASLSANESVTVMITISMLGKQIADAPRIEQLRFTTPFAQ